MSGGGRGGGPPLVGPGGSSASGPSPNMSMMTTTGQGRWYFSAERLHMTPSRRHDISSERELGYRQQAANFIQDMGQRLHVPQLCINTAIVYMQRFYMFHSFKHFHRNTIAVAALFLAAKVEEQPRKLEHVIKVAHICLHRDQAPLDTRSEQYMEQAQELVTNENILLQTLGFDVAIDHPHTHVVRCCQLVKASKDLAQTSYFMATNSLHLTTMCLRHTPTIVACVCIHLACKWTNYKIPLSSRGKEWFLYVDPNTSLELLNKLTDEFLTIFDRCPSRLKKKIMATAQATKEEEERRASNDIPASQYTPDYSRRHETPSSSNASKQHIIPMGKSSSASSQQQSQVRPGHHGTTRNDKPHRSSGPPDNNNKQPSMSHKPMDPARAAAYDEYKKQQQSRLSSQQQQSAHRQMPRPGTHLQPPSGRPPPPSMSSSQKQPQVHSKPPPPLHHPPRQPWIQPPKSGGSSSSKPPEPPRHHHAKQQPPSLPPPPPPQQQRSIPHHPTHKPERKPATAAPLRKSIFDIDDESPPLHSKPEAPPLPNPTSGNGLLNIMLDPTVPLHSIIKSNSPNSSKKEERSPPPPPKQPRTASLFSPPSSSRVRSLSNASGSSSSEEVVSLKLPKVEETPGYEKLRDGVTSIQIPKTSSSSTSNHHSKEEQQHHLLQEEGVGGSSSSSSRKKHKKEKKSKKEKKEKKDKRDKSSSSSSSSHHHKSRHQEEDIHHHHHRSSESGEGGKHPGIKLKIKPLPPVSSEESSSPHLPKVDPLKISLKPTEATSTANTAASSSKKRLRPSDHHPLSPSFKVARVMNQDLFSSPPDALKKTH